MLQASSTRLPNLPNKNNKNTEQKRSLKENLPIQLPHPTQQVGVSTNSPMLNSVHFTFMQNTTVHNKDSNSDPIGFIEARHINHANFRLQHIHRLLPLNASLQQFCFHRQVSLTNLMKRCTASFSNKKKAYSCYNIHIRTMSQATIKKRDLTLTHAYAMTYITIYTRYRTVTIQHNDTTNETVKLFIATAA